MSARLPREQPAVWVVVGTERAMLNRVAQEFVSQGGVLRYGVQRGKAEANARGAGASCRLSELVGQDLARR